MNKILAMMVAFTMVATMFVPVVSALNTQSVINTNVVISTGSGNIPIVKVKWEQDTSTSLEDGDAIHAIPGSSFNPSCQYKVNKTVKYYAIVTDVEDSGNLAQVWADVYHPLNTWEDGSFKYEIPFTRLDDKATAISLLTTATGYNLTTYNSAYNLSEVINEINKGTAKLWYGQAELDYEQPGGDYKVEVIGLDTNNNPSVALVNHFTYVKTTCFAIDNTAVNYGSVNIGTHKPIAGDIHFVNGDNLLTVRNLGNTYMQLKVYQDDMGFNKDVNGMWNVQFDAQIGHLLSSVNYDPFVWTLVPGVLPHSTDDELDLSILVKKGFGTHTGNMTLGSVIVPYPYTPLPGLPI